ncbi:pseudouridine synthase [Marinomonas sp. 2405UD68-3]|uniref:pseudouridine synthase n=1 Tax=Marinomonas sp. 2405UD68-3 TaxID=3391835 RepID=UPI0039C92126
MRLDYYLSHAQGLSRKDAKINIKKNKVQVNGVVVKKANHQVLESDQIMLGDIVIEWPSDRYYMMNKPADLVCANQDAEQTTVMTLLPEHLHKGLNIVGRLDKDTTGLLLLTTDGQWLHRITSPKHECSKTYLVHLDSVMSEQAVSELTQGVMLNGESVSTLPATVEVVTETCIRLTIKEGKYHQVKRMLAAVGNHVVSLHREGIGGVELDSELAVGEFRELTLEEIETLR